jgi:hypothetical protein
LTGDITEVTTGPVSVIQVYAEPVTVVEVVTAGPTGPPGSASSGFQFEQPIPAAVWGPITHGLGFRPAGVSLFDGPLFGTQYDEFAVEHLDENTLRIAMDKPTAGVALMS